MLRVKQNVLTLKGITLRGSIQLFNPNENLAIIFEIEPPPGLELCIQPRRGIVMQQQIKIVKAWIKDEDREKALLMNFAGKSLRISSTMKAQYNRKMFERLNLNGWEKVKQSYEMLQIPIIISSQARNVRSEIKSQASNSLNKISHSRESIGSKYRQQFKVGQSYSHGRDMPEINRKKINEKLDRELDFLFENAESRKTQYLPKYSRGEDVEYSPYLKRDQVYRSRKKEEFVTYQPLKQINNNSYKVSGQNNEMMNKNAQNQRFLQIIMLAALAGFFAALGSNFKHLFK